MRFEVKQAVLSSSMVAEVNSTDTYPQFYKDYLDVTYKPTQDLINKSRYLYQTVGFIEADSADGVFKKGNIWDGFEGDIKHVGVGMHSISIGDLLIDENGDAVVVDRRGFTNIDLKKEEFSNYK
jgi:hypothetical protein